MLAGKLEVTAAASIVAVVASIVAAAASVVVVLADAATSYVWVVARAELELQSIFPDGAVTILVPRLGTVGADELAATAA